MVGTTTTSGVLFCAKTSATVVGVLATTTTVSLLVDCVLGVAQALSRVPAKPQLRRVRHSIFIWVKLSGLGKEGQLGCIVQQINPPDLYSLHRQARALAQVGQEFRAPFGHDQIESLVGDAVA